MEENKENAMQEQTKEEKEEVKPKAASIIAEAYDAAEKVKSERELLEKVVAELRELKAYSVLGGTTDAGEQPVKQREETPKEYKDRIMREGGVVPK